MTILLQNFIFRDKVYPKGDPSLDLEIKAINNPHEATSPKGLPSPVTLTPRPSQDRHMSVKYKDCVFLTFSLVKLIINN